MTKDFFSVSMSASPYPKKDVFGGVEAGGIDAGRVGRGSLAHDAASEAWDGTLYGLCVRVTLAARDGVRHNKIYWTFCGTTDLGTQIQSVFDTADCNLLPFFIFTFQKKNYSPILYECPCVHLCMCVCLCMCLPIICLAWLILNPKQISQLHIVLHPVTHWEFKTTVMITVIMKPCSGICLD